MEFVHLSTVFNVNSDFKNGFGHFFGLRSGCSRSRTFQFNCLDLSSITENQIWKTTNHLRIVKLNLQLVSFIYTIFSPIFDAAQFFAVFVFYVKYMTVMLPAWAIIIRITWFMVYQATLAINGDCCFMHCIYNLNYFSTHELCSWSEAFLQNVTSTRMCELIQWFLIKNAYKLQLYDQLAAVCMCLSPFFKPIYGALHYRMNRKRTNYYLYRRVLIINYFNAFSCNLHIIFIFRLVREHCYILIELKPHAQLSTNSKDACL